MINERRQQYVPSQEKYRKSIAVEIVSDISQFSKAHHTVSYEQLVAILSWLYFDQYYKVKVIKNKH